MAIVTQEFFAKLQKYSFIYIKHPVYECVRNEDFVLDIHHDKTNKKYYLKQMNTSIIDIFPKIYLDEKGVLNYLKKFYKKYPIKEIVHVYSIHASIPNKDKNVLDDMYSYYLKSKDNLNGEGIYKLLQEKLNITEGIKFSYTEI